MEVIVGKTSGFCAGVKYTILKAEEELKNNPCGIDCLGEIIHNKQVVDDLSKKGLHTIENIEDAKKKVLIRAHGVSKQIYEYAKKNNITLIDLTCPNVLKIHKQVQDFAAQNYFIFLFGIKGHPETIGTSSFCGENSYIIEDLSSITPAIQKLKSSNLRNVLIISQTTFSVGLFDELVSIILNQIRSDFNVHIEKSICNATHIRQEEANDISSKVDLMIIIGGKNSSNTKKLYEISIKNCKNVIHIQTKEDLNLDFIKKFSKIGIIAGASTPSSTIEEITNICKSF